MEVKTIIDQMISEIKDFKVLDTIHWNERYLHHRFSKLIQNNELYEIKLNNKENKLHPEWATSIKDIRSGGLYAEKNDSYELRKSYKENKKDRNGGNPGFIDFAIGDFNAPDYAIEFKMAKYMDEKRFVFDYMKLLDNRNKFKNVVSLSIVHGRKTKLTDKKLNDNLKEAKEKLKEKEYLSKIQDRKVQFYVIQIIEAELTYMWKCENIEKGFEQQSFN